MNIRLQIASTILKLLCHKNTLLSSTTPMKREICWNLITINWSRMCIWKMIKQIVQSAIIWHFMDLSDSLWSRKVYKSIDKILINISGRTHFIHTCAVLTEKADSNDRGVLYVFIYLCIYCILAASPFIFPFWFDLSAHSDYRSIYLFSICSFHLSVFLFVISHWTGLAKCSLSLNSSEQKPAPVCYGWHCQNPCSSSHIFSPTKARFPFINDHQFVSRMRNVLNEYLCY